MFSEAHARRLRLLHEQLLERARVHQQRATVLLDKERAVLSGFRDEVAGLEREAPSDGTTIADLAQRYALAAYLWRCVERQNEVVERRERDAEEHRLRTTLVYQDLEMWAGLETRIAQESRSEANRIVAREADEAAVVRYTRAVHGNFAETRETPEARPVARRRF